MGQAARRRVSQVGLWSSKVAQVSDLYNQLMGQDSVVRP
jgi:hypothetical protein